MSRETVFVPGTAAAINNARSQLAAARFLAQREGAQEARTQGLDTLLRQRSQLIRDGHLEGSIPRIHGGMSSAEMASAHARMRELAGMSPTQAHLPARPGAPAGNAQPASTAFDGLDEFHRTYQPPAQTEAIYHPFNPGEVLVPARLPVDQARAVVDAKRLQQGRPTASEEAARGAAEAQVRAAAATGKTVMTAYGPVSSHLPTITQHLDDKFGEDWDQKLVARHPQLGVEGSPAHTAFVKALTTVYSKPADQRTGLELNPFLIATNVMTPQRGGDVTARGGIAAPDRLGGVDIAAPPSIAGAGSDWKPIATPAAPATGAQATGQAIRANTVGAVQQAGSWLDRNIYTPIENAARWEANLEKGIFGSKDAPPVPYRTPYSAPSTTPATPVTPVKPAPPSPFDAIPPYPWSTPAAPSSMALGGGSGGTSEGPWGNPAALSHDSFFGAGVPKPSTAAPLTPGSGLDAGAPIWNPATVSADTYYGSGTSTPTAPRPPVTPATSSTGGGTVPAAPAIPKGPALSLNGGTGSGSTSGTYAGMAMTGGGGSGTRKADDLANFSANPADDEFRKKLRGNTDWNDGR